jgi:2-polyprenyl-3-methyl-5-hydroxy-6-metoxy-1,4-benzoquinol methylase
VSSTRPSSEERARHWDRTYAAHQPHELSWHSEDARISIELIQTLGINGDAAVIDVGGGASVLARQLVAQGFIDMTVLDLSTEALAAARQHADDAPVEWLHQDLLSWRPRRRYDVWHDRAVLHFLVEAEDRERYRETLRAALAPDGAVVIGAFAPDGPDRCSGLPVVRYSPEELVALLGADFRLVDTRRDEHLTPSGAVQPFSWIAVRALSAEGNRQP